MLKILEARWRQRYRTVAFPKGKVVLPPRFRGLPVFAQGKCPGGCEQCARSCPTGAIYKDSAKGISIDLGKCLFCLECSRACPEGAITFSQDHRLAVRQRKDLLFSGKELILAKELEQKMLKIFGRSLRLRQVSAGGCNACESDLNVLTTVVFDLGRFGIQFVASPRHADGLLITGPVTENMTLALQKTYAAVSSPKIVIAVGACAISGGPYIDHAQTHNGADSLVPVDLYIPGCPPHPLTILDGLLRMLKKIER